MIKGNLFYVYKGCSIWSVFGLGLVEEGGEDEDCICSASFFSESKLVRAKHAIGFSCF